VGLSVGKRGGVELTNRNHSWIKTCCRFYFSSIIYKVNVVDFIFEVILKLRMLKNRFFNNNRRFANIIQLYWVASGRKNHIRPNSFSLYYFSFLRVGNEHNLPNLLSGHIPYPYCCISPAWKKKLVVVASKICVLTFWYCFNRRHLIWVFLRKLCAEYRWAWFHYYKIK